MAEKKKKLMSASAGNAGADTVAAATGSGKLQRKKILVVVLVILVVVLVSVAVDNAIRNPRTQDEEDAMNQVFSQRVIADNPEITYDTVVEINVQPIEKINGKQYYPVQIITGELPNTKEYGPYYVAIKNSKIFTKDATGQLVPYGV